MSSTQISDKLPRQNTTQKDIKPRSCVSIARLYDWTEDASSHVTTSGLYKETTCVQRVGTASQQKAVFMISNGNKNSPVPKTDYIGYTTNARMFARDKKILTKGEREIIEGIYKNRGDITDRDIIGSKFMVRSHKEAWYSGKSFHRSLGLGTAFLSGVKVDGTVPISCCHFNRDTRLISCVFCETKRENTSSSMITACRKGHYGGRKAIVGEIQEDRGVTGYVAPPSTPDGADSNLNIRHSLHAERSLSTSLFLQPDNLRVHDTYYSKINGISQRESKSPDNVRHKTIRCPHLKSLTTFQKWATNDFSVSALKSPTVTSHEINNLKKKSALGRESEITGELINNPTQDTMNVQAYNRSVDWVDNKDIDHDKRVKVNIYIPTAEGDVKSVSFTSLVSGTKKQRFVTANRLPKL